MTPTQQTELEAAAFRRLIAHLKAHSDVQNIDLMLTADFCRNCLAKWYLARAQEKQIEITYDQARDIVYGMPYEEWKTSYQTQATPEQLAAYQAKLDAKKES